MFPLRNFHIHKKENSARPWNTKNPYFFTTNSLDLTFNQTLNEKKKQNHTFVTKQPTTELTPTAIVGEKTTPSRGSRSSRGGQARRRRRLSFCARRDATRRQSCFYCG